LRLPNSLQVDQRPELAQLVPNLPQKLIQRGIVRNRHGIDVAGKADGRELGMLVTRHLLRNCRRLDESRVGGLPVSLDTHLFLDQAAE
jgi:hypothetical protein